MGCEGGMLRKRNMRAAPGVDILTTNNGGGYGTWYGTSFSSAIVSGLAALVVSVNPALLNSQVVSQPRIGRSIFLVLCEPVPAAENVAGAPTVESGSGRAA